MNIVVLVKQVPDTWAERKLKADDKTLDRASVDVVMNEIDEYAVEEALKLKEAGGGEVTILRVDDDRRHSIGVSAKFESQRSRVRIPDLGEVFI